MSEHGRVGEVNRALLYEADVIDAQSQDVKALSQGRREALARAAERLRALARGEFPYQRVSYGSGLRSDVARESDSGIGRHRR